MRLRKLTLENFRLFSNFEIDFPNSNLAVIIGNNGSGKTTILDAIALCLTHFTGELLSRSKGYNIDEWFLPNDIKEGNNEGKIKLDFIYNLPQKSKFFEKENGNRSIEVIKNRNTTGLGYNKIPENFLQEVKKYLIDNTLNSIPIISYFNVNRTGKQVQHKEEKPTYNSKLMAYEYSLNIHSPTFIEFEKWFIKQQQLENALKVEKQDLKFEIPSLRNVRKAFKTFVNIIDEEIYSDLKIISVKEINPDFSENISEEFAIIKNDFSISFKQLSSGERMIIGLVAEIAKRLTIANENNENALNESGVVLIDEIELHLHPAWQKNIIKALQVTFPNIQFIITTHSPLVLSGVRRENIVVLHSGQVIPSEELPDIFSGTSDEILEKLLFSDNSYNQFADEKHEIDLLFNSLKFDKAEEKLNELKQKVNSRPQWIKDYEQSISFAKS